MDYHGFSPWFFGGLKKPLFRERLKRISRIVPAISDSALTP